MKPREEQVYTAAPRADALLNDHLERLEALHKILVNHSERLSMLAHRLLGDQESTSPADCAKGGDGLIYDLSRRVDWMLEAANLSNEMLSRLENL